MPFLPKELEAAEEALSRLLQIGVAPPLWRACSTLSLTSRTPFPLFHQGKATDMKAGLLAWDDCCWLSQSDR